MPHTDHPRRRILYIRHRRTKKDSPDFVTTLQDEFAEALALHADVTLMQDDFDYGQACDAHKPDFAIYESGWLIPAPLNVSNIETRPDVPLIALATHDPHEPARTRFMRQIEQMKIKWILGHMTEAVVGVSPELQGHIYSVSQFFDDAVYHDYKLEKDIPISIFGGFLEPKLYQWRAQTIPEISEHFPTLVYKHPGYDTPIPRHHFPITGAGFARMINRSHFSLADTSRFDCLLRKHLEIPASGAVLVAPDRASLKAYGFKDMHNCILGSGMDLYKKIAYAADRPDIYESIRRNGYELVHGRYRRQDWHGVLDFYECLRNLQPGETIQQQGILGPFVAVHGDAHTPAIATHYPDSDFSAAMKKAQALILSGDHLDQAEALLMDAVSWAGHLTEPCVPLAIISLLRGQPQEAKKRLLVPHQIRKSRDNLDDFDPVEIAFLFLADVLAQDPELLAITQREMQATQHVSLRRMEWLGKIISSGGGASNPPVNVLSYIAGDRFSTHWMGALPMGQWLSLMTRIFAAHGQQGLLETLSMSTH